MDIKAIKKTEDLAKLVLSEQRFNKLAQNFSEILKYINLLSNARVDNFEDNYIASGLKNVGVKDSVQKEYSLTGGQATANSVKEKNGYIVVPRVIKG
ncbi:Asp-tRNA(Asn)/Glu-tRNA(Gln) amidotransferase subunit GatC [bacterium]|nr:Asp-tRNA(Asn)/Glu-tRNA(Gln) amidotransferase subunit GatC [bacterium]